MRILAIDPGERESAIVAIGHDGEIEMAWKETNKYCLDYVKDESHYGSMCTLAIEFAHARGMPASNNLFRTTLWAGRFLQAWLTNYGYIKPLLINRHDVKLHHCGQARAKDSNIRAAIIDRYGGKEAAIGKKKTPGPLYGVRADEWQALAIALMVRDNAANKAWIDERRLAQ